MNNESAIRLIQTAQWLNNELNQSLSNIDITGQQLKILSILAESEQNRALVNDIKLHMLTPMSNVSRLLNKLMNKQLIIKKRDDIDQRKVYIHITKQGLITLCEGKKLMDDALSIMNKLEASEQRSLVALLTKIKA